jgi:hypothetical protein
LFAIFQSQQVGAYTKFAINLRNILAEMKIWISHHLLENFIFRNKIFNCSSDNLYQEQFETCPVASLWHDKFVNTLQLTVTFTRTYWIHAKFPLNLLESKFYKPSTQNEIMVPSWSRMTRNSIAPFYVGYITVANSFVHCAVWANSYRWLTRDFPAMRHRWFKSYKSSMIHRWLPPIIATLSIYWCFIVDFWQIWPPTVTPPIIYHRHL